MADAPPVTLDDVKRVVIVGRGGAGKSVFARELGVVAGLPVIELDKEFWSDRLEPRPARDWTQHQLSLIERPCWIMDGDLGPYDEVERGFDEPTPSSCSTCRFGCARI